MKSIKGNEDPKLSNETVRRPRPAPEKPLVNHRWNLPSLEGMLDSMLPQWPEGQHPDFSGPDGHARLRNAFLRFSEHLLFELSITLEKAAGKGISQALDLIKNPDYYETVKRRNALEIQRDKEHQERQQKERERWQRCELTEEERAQEIGRIAHDMEYHQKSIERLAARKMKVETTPPMMAEARQDESDNDGDFWSDTILFD